MSFPVERFLKTAGLLASSNEHERATAAKHATAMLTEAGLDWNQVLRAGLGHVGVSSPASAAGKPDLADVVGSMFGDFFSQLHRAKPQPAPQPEPAPRPRRPTSTILQREDIPHAIMGTVTVLDKRQFQPNKYMLVFSIENSGRGEIYSPLVNFDQAQIARLEDAAARTRVVSGRVRQATSELHQPSFVLDAE